ncbi:MAG: CapA family protein [Chloroflexota bacterium]
MRDEQATRETRRIAICGDVMLGRLVNDYIPQRGYEYPWGDVLPLLRDADAFLINQEFALTSSTTPWNPEGKVFHFRADPEMIAALQAANVSFSCLANNHIGDFDVTGLLETLEILDRAGIAHAGAGRNDAEASAPALLDVRGLTIAIVAFTDQMREWIAGPDQPGINYTPISVEPDAFQPVARSIQEARARADLIIFSIHWGPNMRTRPPEHFQEFARRVIDAGADLFWGHSAHILQGIEIHRGKPILYDTGDFVDDYAVDPELRNDLTALFVLEIGPSRIESLDLYPCRIDRMQVNLAEAPERGWLFDSIAERCAEFGTSIGSSLDHFEVVLS